MKTDGREKIDINPTEEPEGNLKAKDAPRKPDQKIKDDTQAFFNTFSQKHWAQKQKPKEPTEEELFLAEVRDLDANTPEILHTELPAAADGIRQTREELLEMYENDPGYVNGKVLDYENVLEKEDNTYQETGLHTGAVHWGDYATEEGVEYATLEEGKILSRWGSEEGSFTSDMDVDYDLLELPVSKDKNVQSLYQVLKQFPVEISKVAKQPWNEDSEDGTKGETVQYRTPIPVGDLVEKGYLKKLEEELAQTQK